MILQTVFEEVIDTQMKSLSQKKIGVQRDMLNKFTLVEHFASIITGIRRSGKSTLLYQIWKSNPDEKIIFLNFEDLRLTGFEVNDYQILLKEIHRREATLLLLDEIQILPKWEVFVRQFLDENRQVVVTGSNASLLSKELGTKLTGRHLSYEMFPFNYKEFLTYTEQEKGIESTASYMQLGGFPEYLKTRNGFILNSLLEDVLYRDIYVRYGLRDIDTLKKIALFLISNIGKPVSGNNLKKLFDIGSAKTVLEHFSYLENAYVVQFLPMFSYSVKKQIRNPKKVYVIDLGFFSENSITFTEEKGRRLENMVFLALRQKYQELYYFQENNECDFVVFDKNRIKKVVQVCYDLHTQNIQRELKGLEEAMDLFNLEEGTIVTFDKRDSLSLKGKKINIIPYMDFVEEV